MAYAVQQLCHGELALRRVQSLQFIADPGETVLLVEVRGQDQNSAVSGIADGVGHAVAPGTISRGPAEVEDGQDGAYSEAPVGQSLVPGRRRPLGSGEGVLAQG